MLLVASLFLSACAVHQPLLVKDQAHLINAKDRGWKKYAEPTQTQMSASNQSLALVVFGGGSDTAPGIYPGTSPLNIAFNHQLEVSSGETCFIVYKRSLPLLPERTGCSRLAFDAAQLHKLMDEVARAQRDVDQMKKIVGPMATMVEFHEQQLKAVDASLQDLAKGLKTAADMVTANNNQVESLIVTSNNEFENLRKSMERMESQLAKVK